MATDTLSKLISAALKSVPGGNAVSNAATKALSGYGGSSSSSSGSSSKSSSSSYSPYTPKESDWFGQKYATNISGLAQYNKTDYDTAKSMLIANLTGGGKYQGGGVLDYGIAGADAKRYQNEPKSYNYSTTPYDTTYIPTSSIDPQKYIEDLKKAQLKSRMAALDKSRTSALSSLDAEQSSIAPTYYDKRNQAAARSDVGALNFAQYMASRGIKGSAGAMPEIYRNAALQGQLGALDQAEASANADIARRRSGVESAYASDAAAANADVEAQALQAYINQMNADREYNLQVGNATGNISGTPTLAMQQFQYSKSNDNPDVAARILANRAQELENAAKEIENSYLPDTLKLQAQRLAQQVKTGSLDYDTALAQLNQIKAQTNRSNTSSNPYLGYQDYYKQGSSMLNATQPRISVDSNGNENVVGTIRRYTDADILDWIRGLSITAEEKARLANDLGI
jgi:hypothetical protein